MDSGGAAPMDLGLPPRGKIPFLRQTGSKIGRLLAVSGGPCPVLVPCGITS